MSRVIAAFAQFFDGSGDPLANGYLRFMISKSVNTNKDTYADVDHTIPNSNPVQLDAEGRCPNVFGQGIYKVILYSVNPVTGLPGAMLQTFDPVVADYQSEGAGGNFAEWSIDTIYQIGQIVIYNGLYYRSHVANNIGNQPDISPDVWERIGFLRFWNLDVSYGLDDVTIYNSNLYFSLQAMNLNHQPDISPAWWDPVGSGTIFLNWQESGTSFIPVVSGFDIGNSTNRIGDLFQSDNSYHYFGDSQQAAIYHDGNDLFIEERSGDIIIGTESPSTGEILFVTGGIAKWSIPVQGRLVPEVTNTYDIGSGARLIMDFFQGDNGKHYFGNSQDTTLFFDGTDFNISIGSNVWKLLSGGHLQPQTDATFDIGDASHKVKRIFISDVPSTDYEAINKAYLDGILYEQPKLNLFDNGDFLIAQRATSQTTTGAASVDRWGQGFVTSTSTMSQQTFALGQTDVPGNPKKYLRFVTVTGGTAGSNVVFRQSVFNLLITSGNSLTLSFYAKADASKDIAIEGLQYFGTGGSPSATVNGISVTTVSLSTLWQLYVVTLNFPSLSTKTIGTNNDEYFLINVWLDAGSDWNSRTNSLGNQSGTFEFSDFQLLTGTDSQVYQRKDFIKSYKECLPFYEKSWNYEISVGTSGYKGAVYGVKAINGTALIEETPSFKVPKFVEPSVTIYSGNDGSANNIYDVSGAANVSVSSVGFISKKEVTQINLGSGLSIGNVFWYHWTADTGY